MSTPAYYCLCLLYFRNRFYRSCSLIPNGSIVLSSISVYSLSWSHMPSGTHWVWGSVQHCFELPMGDPECLMNIYYAFNALCDIRMCIEI